MHSTKKKKPKHFILHNFINATTLHKSHSCPSSISKAAANPQGGWTELHQIWGKRSSVIGAPNPALRYRHAAPFQNEGSSKKSGVVSRGQMSHLLTPAKIRGGLGKLLSEKYLLSRSVFAAAEIRSLVKIVQQQNLTASE